MANTVISPNMNLPVPVVSVDPGPDWASNLNACLSAIDSHDHSPGKGVLITPAGMFIDADLSINDFALTNVGVLQLSDLLATLPGALFAGAVYQVSGDLWYTNGAGFPVQLTQGNFNNATVLAANQILTITSSTTLTNKTIHYVTTTSPVSLQLPTPSANTYIVIKDATGGAETNPITLVRFGSEKIETVAASFSLNYSLGSWAITSNGTDWFIT